MRVWWKEGVIYQIYPRSFCDSNGDGIGDLRGIISKLDYLQGLGVTAVWLSPIYASPNCDNGYDISDYRSIHPDFGSMSDFDEMIQGMHARGIKLIMDLVVNHTSDQHEWFKRALNGEEKYKNYYFFRQGTERRPPNNWTAFFGGRAWQRVQGKEYYLHLFEKGQPDLNFDNPEVREEVKDICRFWLDKGVDGFRCDVINIISKAEGLPNGKPNIALVGKEHYLCGVNFRRYFSEIKEVLDGYNAMTVGESVLMDMDTASTYLNERNGIFNMFFHFEHMNVDCYFVKWFGKRYKPFKLKQVLSRWQTGLDGWNSLYFENHDQPRSVSRFGSEGELRVKSAQMLASLLFFQRGTPYIYQGQEIGMTNAHFTRLEQYQDCESHNIYRIGAKIFGHKRMMKKLAKSSRDNARTPMQWNAERFAGFSSVVPWIEVNSNYVDINVQGDTNADDSVIRFYQRLIQFRKNNEVTVYGEYTEHFAKHKQLWVIERRLGEKQVFLVANLTDRVASLPREFLQGKELVFGNYDSDNGVSKEGLSDEDDVGVIKPYEVRVLAGNV